MTTVIPAYNVEEYVGRAIDSVLGQTLAAEEIIVVDDGSTDGTGERIARYGSRVRCIHQENQGLACARNTGIKAATCEWIAFLDGDDEWDAHGLAEHVAVIQRNPDLRWCTGNTLRCLCDENRRGPDLSIARAKKLLAGEDCFDDYFLACRNGAGGNANTMVIRKEVFEEIGLFNTHQVFAEDLDMWWRIAYRYPRIGYVVKPVAVYHMTRPDAMTQTFKTDKMRVLADLLERHLTLAEQNNRLQEFRALASQLVHDWLRSILFCNCPEEINGLLTRFGSLLSLRFRWSVRFLMLAPRATAKMCHCISRIVRLFRLRRKIVRRPDVPQQPQTKGNER